MQQPKPFNSFQMFLSLLLLMTVLCGCIKPGSITSDFEGFVVPVDSRPGAARLQFEMDWDSTICGFVAGKGKPDYIFVVDSRTVKLIYMPSKEVAIFHRPFASPQSKVSIETNLTPDITARLGELDKAAFATLNH
jgi:hypothetical protein